TIFVESDVPASGADLVRALAQVRAPWTPASLRPTIPAAGLPAPGGQGSLIFLKRTTYVRAVVWIVARLAEALEHAHQRGVLHRDIKPSNILLSHDGQPMLLDFNLAQNVAGEQSQAEATLGGTVAYMAPEHLLAISRQEPALVQQVGRPADIYSLGMVLYEMLTGQSPFDQSASYHPLPALIESMAAERQRRVPSLRPTIRKKGLSSQRRSRGRPDVSWSLESINRKSLAPDQRQRYQSAE